MVSQWAKTPSHAAEACAEGKTLTFSCTQNPILAPHPHPHKTRWLRNKRNLNIRTFQKQRMLWLGVSCVDTPYNKWPGSKVIQLKPAPPVLQHTSSPYENQLWSQDLGIWAFEHELPLLLSGISFNKTASLSPLQFLVFSIWLC